MEPGHLTSFVTSSRMISQDPSLQTPHQRKSFLHPILHMRATKVTRCSPLQQHPLLESSYRRPAWNLPTWATSLVKQMYFSFILHTGQQGGGQELRHLSFFASFSGILITFTTVGLLVLIALTLKLFASPHVEMECEQQGESMFPS